MNLCDMLANTEGSWLWAAQIKDDRHLAEFVERFEQAQRTGETYRPPLEGYSGVLAAIVGLRNDIRLVNRLPLLEGPETPVDRVKERKKLLSNQRLDAVLGYDDREVS